MSDLKNMAFRGGSQLLIRQILGMVLAFVGTTLVARLIGPANYGIYVTVSVSCFYAFILLELGIGTYLARLTQGAAISQIEKQAFCILSLLSVGGVAIAAVALSIVNVPSTGLVILFVIGLPSQLINVVPLARLERELRYQLVARIELTFQCVFYSIALICTLYRRDAWAPSIAWLGQQVVTTILLHWSARSSVGLVWNRAIVREMLTYGIGVSSAGWIWHLRRLVNPWVVGWLAGPEVVGIIAITTRFIDALTFIQSSIWRLSLPIMGRLIEDKDKVLSVIDETTRLLTPLTGVTLLSFALVGPFLVEHLMGRNWSAVFAIFPFLAISAVANSTVALHSSALYALGKSFYVTAIYIVSTAVLTIGSMIFVPRFGAVGYGIAELCAIPTCVFFHLTLFRFLGRAPRYGFLPLWGCLFCIGIFYWPLNIATLLMTAASPSFRVALATNIGHLRDAYNG